MLKQKKKNKESKLRSSTKKKTKRFHVTLSALDANYIRKLAKKQKTSASGLIRSIVSKKLASLEC